MMDFKMFRTVFAVGAILMATGLSASAQASAAQEVKTVVLVHGAWSNSSSWSKVIPLLEAKGLNVIAIQLPLTSLEDDVATVKRALALEDGPVLLVAHSYGGAVITEAGNDPKVAGLVYIAAVAPDQGESAFGLITSVATPVGAELRPDSMGFLKLTPKGIAEDFAQGLPASEIQVLTATQAPTNVAAMKGEIPDPRQALERVLLSPVHPGDLHMVPLSLRSVRARVIRPILSLAGWCCLREWRGKRMSRGLHREGF
jgi:pimeloyl-ACP methyl ester carboxylesterase